MPSDAKCENVGKVVYLLEKEGYSIITVEKLATPIYIQGKVNTKLVIPSNTDCHIWENPKGRYHFVWYYQRYYIDGEKTKL